ncbi:unnamed protein product, partial [Mesorhabditis spiculigera]
MVSMRLNLSMGVTCMVNSTAFEKPSPPQNNSIRQDTRQCLYAYDESTPTESGYGGTLLWSPSMQGLLFSATFYGSLVTIAISGYFADRFGPKAILFVAALDYTLMTLLGPVLAGNSYWAYFGSRLIIGVGEGFVFPCINCMVAKWFPQSEKSTVGAIYTSGTQIAAEENLSSKAQADIFKENSIPWRELFFGKACLANYTSQFAFNFAASLMQAFLPTYFKEVLHIPIHMNGIFTMVPFASQITSKLILGMVSDYMKRNKILDPDVSGKIFQGVSAFGSGMALFALGYIPSCESPFIALPILLAYGIFFSFAICGFFTSLISIAPPYSGTMTSISMTYATVANVSGPMLLSFIEFMGWPHKWMIIFTCASSMCMLSGVHYIYAGEAKVQEWARMKPLFSFSSHRLRIAFLLSAAFCLTVCMRVNLSLGITCMVNATAFLPLHTNTSKLKLEKPLPPACHPIDDEKIAQQDGYGLVTMCFAGYLADRYGPKITLLGAVLNCMVATLIGPIMAVRTYSGFWVSRAMLGVGQTFVFPSCNAMASKWFPPEERATIGAIYTSGVQVAAGVTSFIVAALCTSSLGWQSIFYGF